MDKMGHSMSTAQLVQGLNVMILANPAGSGIAYHMEPPCFEEVVYELVLDTEPNSEGLIFTPTNVHGNEYAFDESPGTIYQITGGLRSALGYCGCKNIEDMKENAVFNRITNAGLRESHPHNVNITKESPNYFVQ